MEGRQIIKQMVTFNQETFNNAYQAMVLIQDQCERIAQTTMDQATWMPPEGRKAMDSWTKVYKTGRDNYKSYVDDSFKMLEKYVAE